MIGFIIGVVVSFIVTNVYLKMLKRKTFDKIRDSYDMGFRDALALQKPKEKNNGKKRTKGNANNSTVKQVSGTDK